LEEKGEDVIKDFYEAEKKYESLFNRIEDAYTHHFIAFNNISFERTIASVFDESVELATCIDGKTKKNSLTTHFYYKVNKEFQNDDQYAKLVYLADFITNKFRSYGFNKYKFYFDIYYLGGNDYYRLHCFPMESKPIDNNWFYILSFYTSVLLDYLIKIDSTLIRPCKIFYDKGLFHKDMDLYDIMGILIDKNL